MIEKEFTYDNLFVREVVISLCRTLQKRIRWINRFENGKKIRVMIPFYTNMVGQERPLLDAFVDDVSDKRVELNTDQAQRAVVTLNSIASISDEYANPNQYLSKKAKINDEIRTIITKVKAVPMKLGFDVEIKLMSENEIYTCSEKILNLLYNYFFFSIDYFGMKIDANLSLPDDKSLEIPREINLTTDNKKTIKMSLEVRTYYPIFQYDIDDFEVCDNDDSIDWNYLEVIKPSLTLLDHPELLENSDPFKRYQLVRKCIFKDYIYPMDKASEEPTKTKVWEDEKLGIEKIMKWPTENYDTITGITSSIVE